MPLLIIDDDTRILNLLGNFFKKHGFDVLIADNTQTARTLMLENTISMIILDVMMPRESGFEFLKDIRRYYPTLPALFLSAKDTPKDRIEGFEVGADDYVVKPFDPFEMLMRVQAILKRTYPHDDKIISFGAGVTFSKNNERLYVNNKPVELSSTQIQLLRILLRTPFQPISRKSLAKQLSHHISERSVDVQIARLRKIIGKDTLKTIRHVGYMICPLDHDKDVGSVD